MLHSRRAVHVNDVDDIDAVEPLVHLPRPATTPLDEVVGVIISRVPGI